jgi:SAM-dependent methyltransferase
VDDATDNAPEALVAVGYDAVYAAVPKAPTLWQIWLDHAVGTDFPAAFSHISFATVADLDALAAALRLSDGDVLVDIACGMGGPSLWMAEHLPVRVVGVDASPIAIEAAESRAGRLGLGARSRFGAGTFGRTGLDDRTADAVLSLDALQYAPSKVAAFREAARISKAGARLAFTAFEVLRDRVAGLPVLGDDPVDDYEPLLDGAGFDVETYEETPGWTERVAAAFGAILEQRTALEREMGEVAYGALSLEARLTLELRPYRRRVVAIATRRS